jgi:hypothetical protein
MNYFFGAAISRFVAKALCNEAISSSVIFLRYLTARMGHLKYGALIDNLWLSQKKIE